LTLDGHEAVEAKNAKRETLLEIVHYVVANPNCLTAQVFQEVAVMVEANVFRPLPPRLNARADDFELEDMETVDDLAWPHLHIVYELLLQVLESPNFNKKDAKSAFPETFALHLLQMFETEDAREREFLKMAVHKLYRKFLHLRTYVREQMGFMLQDFVAQPQERGCGGVFEMLEILGSIVEGFAVPLKPNHVEYLNRTLLPLIKIPAFVVYHSPLLYCFLQYVIKDAVLAAPIVKYFFRHWPVQSARKQVLLLSSIDHLVGALDEQELGRSVGPVLIGNLAKTLRTPHFQVADKCMALLQTLKVKEYIRRNSAAVVKVIYPVLTAVSHHHWNQNLQHTAEDLRKWLQALNASATRECDLAASSQTLPGSVPSTWQRMFALEREPPRSNQQLGRSRSKFDQETASMIAKYNVAQHNFSKENVKNL
jgi:serine/threonine-protein phosphatase 2A regulatory subunit B'